MRLLQRPPLLQMQYLTDWCTDSQDKQKSISILITKLFQKFCGGNFPVNHSRSMSCVHSCSPRENGKRLWKGGAKSCVSLALRLLLHCCPQDVIQQLLYYSSGSCSSGYHVLFTQNWRLWIPFQTVDACFNCAICVCLYMSQSSRCRLMSRITTPEQGVISVWEYY